MNRQMKRQQQRKKLTNQDIQEIQRETIEFTISCIMGSLMIVMHDEFGFGEVRLKRLVDRLMTQYDCINEGYVDLKDIQEYVLKEFKIDLKPE